MVAPHNFFFGGAKTADVGTEAADRHHGDEDCYWTPVRDKTLECALETRNDHRR